MGAEIGGHHAKRNGQPVEVAARDEIATEHGGIEQGVGFGLPHRGALQVEAAIALLPDDERLKPAQGARSPRLEGGEQRSNGKGARQRVDGARRIAAGVHGAHHRSHAGTDDQVRPDTQAVERAEQANMGESLGSAAREHQRRAGRSALLGGSGIGRRDRMQE